LVSGSPRRSDLLKQLGLKFEVLPGDYQEPDPAGRDPTEFVTESSLGKAKSVTCGLAQGLIIAADTVGVFKGRILGKPRGAREAFDMLKLINNDEHTVITGFSLLDRTTGETYSQAVTTRVFMKSLSPEEIDAYVSTGEGLDKAGAYAIQGLGAILVEKIEGDYNNVVGLPLFAVAAALEKFGIKVLKTENRALL